MSLYDFLKSLLLLTLFIYITPHIIEKIKKTYLYQLEPHSYIGVITINTPLTESAPYSEKLNLFFKNSFIKGILLKIDCADSLAGTSQIIFNEIQQLKKHYPKPIVTLIENQALSGAYLIASVSDYIIASESAIIGNIGVYSLSLATDTLANDIYQQNTKHIAVTRKLSVATIDQWAGQKLFTGKQAAATGLINETGSLFTALTIFKRKALIEGEIELVTHTNQLTTNGEISSFAINVQYRND